MKVQYAPAFLVTLKRASVRVRNTFKQRIALFEQNPYDLQLDNHALAGEWIGCRSIDITADYRAIYEEIRTPYGDVIAYFLAIGTHKQLYS